MAEDVLAGDQQFGLDFVDHSPAKSERAPKLPNPNFFVSKSKPTPSEVFKSYWRFAALRQRVFYARVLGKPELTSRDPIISQYRFTNAYRASDRVSQYLIRHVIYDRKWSTEDLFFRIMLFKFFNKIETWEALKREFGEITWRTYSFEHYGAVLSRMMEAGERIYSAAYIMSSGRSAFGHAKKYKNHLLVIENMMHDRVPDRIIQQPDLESVFNLLRTYPCIGPFTGYQYTIDLSYSELVDFSENDFVEAGPGALDGIAKCFTDHGDYGASDMIRYMADIQSDAFELYAPEFQDLWGRPLHLIDCQSIFCEVDKYARVAHPKVKGRSGRTRIKQSYKQSPLKRDLPWYPPKWGLNDLIAQTNLI